MDIAELANKPRTANHPRGVDYVRGYRTAMEYAASFTREAGKGTPFKRAFEVLGSHFEEKIGRTEASAALEAKLVEAYSRLLDAFEFEPEAEDSQP